jgi:exopolysaccharide production protein ExoY
MHEVIEYDRNCPSTMHREPTSDHRNSPDFASALPKWKRTVDVACCILAVPVLAVLTFFVACVTAATAKGPIFFRQEKVGLKGQRIRLYRFRTMRLKSEPNALLSQKAAVEGDGSPRVDLLIPGGRFLRATGLAELPQIVNVLRGEMSIVGPKPLHREEAGNDESGRQVLSSLPGLTGLWRVSCANTPLVDDPARLDSHYARHKSLWLDSKIILLTIPALCLDIVTSGSSRADRARAVTQAATESMRLNTSQQPW